MAYGDWSAGDYDYFHDHAFEEIFNALDLEGLSEEEITAAEEAFQAGWLDLETTEDNRYQARLDFADIMGYEIDFSTGAQIDFDWETFRELYDEAGG